MDGIRTEGLWDSGVGIYSWYIRQMCETLKPYLRNFLV